MSFDEQKTCIRPPEVRSDYLLLHKPVPALMDANHTEAALDSGKHSEPPEEATQQVNSIIVSNLSDQTLGATRFVIGDPAITLEKLDRSYISRSANLKISKMSELAYTR